MSSTTHHNPESADLGKNLKVAPRFYYLAFALIAIGIITVAAGFAMNPVKTWANVLMNNYYFLSLALGASFLAALFYITQSGWSAGFVRIPQAMANFIPVAGVLMIPVLLFGMHTLYHWTHAEALATDPIIAHKAPYLNMPFFVFRFLLFFGLWTFFSQMLRRFSLKEDLQGGLTYFTKSEFWSKVYIFVLAGTFSLASFDYIMSIDVHWFSTIFAVRNFVASFYHGTVVVTMIIIILHKSGYLPFLQKSHLRDFARYIFILCIIWTYTWFTQYILIWYANIPEETIYYMPRTQGEFVPLFYGELILNWLFPFLFLMPTKVSTNMNALLFAGIVLMIGHWVDFYQQVIVGTYHHLHIGLIEIGTFLGYIGLFAAVVAWSLARVPLVAKNHPYLEESLQNH